VFADFSPLAELGELQRAVYFGDGKKHLSWDYLKALTPLALAVWYMDDGSSPSGPRGSSSEPRVGSGGSRLCVEAMSSETRARVVEYCGTPTGFDVKLTVRGARQISVLQFTTAASARFQEIVAPYVHPSMEYKLLPRFRGQFAVSQPVRRAGDCDRSLPGSSIFHVKPPTRSMNRSTIGWRETTTTSLTAHGAQQPRDHDRW